MEAESLKTKKNFRVELRRVSASLLVLLEVGSTSLIINHLSIFDCIKNKKKLSANLVAWIVLMFFREMIWNSKKFISMFPIRFENSNCTILVEFYLYTLSILA